MRINMVRGVIQLFKKGILTVMMLLLFALSVSAAEKKPKPPVHDKPKFHTVCLGGHAYVVAYTKTGVDIEQMYTTAGKDDKRLVPVRCGK